MDLISMLIVLLGAVIGALCVGFGWWMCSMTKNGIMPTLNIETKVEKAARRARKEKDATDDNTYGDVLDDRGEKPYED